MFRLEMLPAAHGDCLWIEYGTAAEVHRILIDGGPAHTYPALRERILHLPVQERWFDLLVITHIDADHIEGIVRLLQDAPALCCRFESIWFNGRDQLNQVPDPAGPPLGALQGELLAMLIREYEERTASSVWNAGLPERLAAFDSRTSRPPEIMLPGDCRLTLLSPDFTRLLDLKDNWDKALQKAGIASGDTQELKLKLMENRSLRPLGDILGVEDQPLEGRFELPDPDDRDLAAEFDDALGGGDSEPDEQTPFGSDASVANGSSIALLLEYPHSNPKIRFLLAGDAWPSLLEASIRKLISGTEAKLFLTGFKIPHHGSVANLSPAVMSLLQCRNYLISSSGAVFRHPHKRAIEMLLQEHNDRRRPCLHFNYLTKTTSAWSDSTDQRTKNYTAFHPKGISLAIDTDESG